MLEEQNRSDMKLVTVSRRNGVSLADQIRQALLEQIERGELKPGQQLPVERDIAHEFGVSLAPVRAALASLARSGLVERIQGKGTFVGQRSPSVEIGIYPSFTDMMIKSGVEFSMNVINQEVIKTPPAVIETLREDAPSEVVWLRRIALIGSSRVALLDSWVDASRFGDLVEVTGFSDRKSLYRTLTERYGIAMSSRGGVLAVVVADDDVRTSLDLEVGSSVVTITTTADDADGKPIEVARIRYVPAAFTFRLPGRPRVK